MPYNIIELPLLKSGKLDSFDALHFFICLTLTVTSLTSGSWWFHCDQTLSETCHLPKPKFLIRSWPSTQRSGKSLWGRNNSWCKLRERPWQGPFSACWLPWKILIHRSTISRYIGSYLFICLKKFILLIFWWDYYIETNSNTFWLNLNLNFLNWFWFKDVYLNWYFRAIL